jgi:hypothetical protein
MKRFWKFLPGLLIIVLFPVLVFAVRIQSYNGTVKSVASNGKLTIEVDRGSNYSADQRYSDYTVIPTSGTYSAGDPITFTVNEDVTPPQVVADSLSNGTDPNANVGVGSASNPSVFRLFPDLSCPDATALTCFTNRIFGFTQIAVLLLSVAAFVIAGIIYMTSGGNPKQIEMAKKIMIGALSAIAVVILGRFFLTKIVGVQLS